MSIFKSLLMKKFSRLHIGAIIMILSVIPFFGFTQTINRSRVIIKAEKRLRKMENPIPGWSHVGRIRFDSLSILPDRHIVQVFYTTPLSFIPVRENEVAHVENSVREALGRKFRNDAIEIYTDHHLLKELVPNSFRASIPVDQNRISGDKSNRIPVVQQSGKEKPLSGLYNNNIAVWDSHGWYSVSYTHLRAHETRHDLVCR